MRKKIYALFLFLLITQICFGQWYQQNSGTTKNLNAVHFVNEYNGWAVGDSGTIIKTTDLGNSWNAQISGTMTPLNDICFTDDNYGWIVGSTGDWSSPETIMLHTTNGGVEWIQQAVGDSLILNAICFINDSIGWVVGGSDDPWPVNFIPMILKTTDGGNNWIYQSAPTEWLLNDVYFIDANIGFIAGGLEWGDGSWGELLKTTNGGDNWSEIAQGFTCWNAISFLDAQNGIVVGNVNPALGALGDIFRTTDGGTNWLLALEIDHSRFYGVTVIDSNHVWAVGIVEWGTFTILFSSDKGINWTSQEAFPNYLLNDVCFFNSSTGWVVGANGTILHTTNGGVSFVYDEKTQPTEFILEQNFPNPFNPTTTINYSVPQTSQVQIKIFDVLGDEIETLVNEEKAAGTYEVTWYAENLPSGVYFYQLRAGSFVETKKMLLLK